MDWQCHLGAILPSFGQRDVADNQVKGFIVENKKTPGFKTEKIENKIGLRVVQNALITMEDLPCSRRKPACRTIIHSGIRRRY
jgi:alkylation response protein AidB-like acyl-CoA dehydrogenase